MAIAFSDAGIMLNETNSTHELAAPDPTPSDGIFMFMISALSGMAELLTNDEGDWTKIIEVQNTVGVDRTLAAWWKIAASETGTYTVSHDSSKQFWGSIVAYTGVNPTVPMDQTPTTNEGVANSDTHTPASITTQTDQAWPLTVIMKNGHASYAVEPTDSTLRSGADTDNKFLGLADTGAESIGPYQFENWTSLGANAESDSITFALRPTVAGGAAPNSLTLLGVG